MKLDLARARRELELELQGIESSLKMLDFLESRFGRKTQTRLKKETAVDKIRRLISEGVTEREDLKNRLVAEGVKYPHDALRRFGIRRTAHRTRGESVKNRLLRAIASTPGARVKDVVGEVGCTDAYPSILASQGYLKRDGRGYAITEKGKDAIKS